MGKHLSSVCLSTSAEFSQPLTLVTIKNEERGKNVFCLFYLVSAQANFHCFHRFMINDCQPINYSTSARRIWSNKSITMTCVATSLFHSSNTQQGWAERFFHWIIALDPFIVAKFYSKSKFTKRLVAKIESRGTWCIHFPNKARSRVITCQVWTNEKAGNSMTRVKKFQIIRSKP